MKTRSIHSIERAQADYKRLFEESPVPMFIYSNVSLRFLDVNTAAVQQYGYSKEELLQMVIPDIRANEEAEQDTIVMKLSSTNNFYDSGIRSHIKKCGGVFSAQVYSYAVPFGDKTAHAMLAIDIKNIIPQEAQVARLQTNIPVKDTTRLHSTAHEVIWQADIKDFSFINISTACANLCGYTPDELMNSDRWLHQLIHPADRQLVAAARYTLIETGHVTVECRVQHKDGSTRHIINDAILKPGTYGSPVLVRCVTIDITQLREKNSSHLQHDDDVLERMTEGFFSLDRNWKFTYVNKEMESILQYSREELLGQCYWDVFPHLVGQKVYYEYNRVMNKGVNIYVEEFAPRLRKWLSINVHPVAAGISVYMRDVTDEKNQLVTIQTQASRLNEIAALQSHQVRGPVASILGLIELFNRDNLNDPDNGEILDHLKLAAHNLDAIIKEVVEKSKIPKA